MTNHTPPDQLRFLNQWFQTWSDYQKEDFLQALASKLSVKSSSVNGVISEMESLSTSSGRPPSLFACQIKLFKEWWDSWSEEDRGKFTDQLKTSDGKFWADLENEMDGTRMKDFDDFFNVEPEVEDQEPLNSVEDSKLIEITATNGHNSPGPNQILANEDDASKTVDEVEVNGEGAEKKEVTESNNSEVI